MASLNLEYWKKTYFYSNFVTYCNNKRIEVSGFSLLLYIKECDRRYLKGIKKRNDTNERRNAKAD